MSAVFLGLIAACAWGFHDICVRYVSQKTPLMASLLTVLLAGLVFHLGVMVIEDGFAPLPPTVLALSALAGAFFLMASLGLYGAFQRGPVRLVAPIIASYPILSVALAAASGVTVSLLEWLAVIAIITGVSVVAALSDSKRENVPPRTRTIAYATISAFGFAGTFAIGQMASEMAGDLPVTLVTRVVSIALLLVIIFAMGLPAWPGRKAMPVLCLMGFADGIALLCVFSAGALPDAQYAAVASSTFGLLTILMAWAFLREHMNLPQWAGCALTFSGIGYLAL